MFSNFAWSEMLVIAAVAIIVVGPKDLPAMLRSLGKTIGGVKRMAGDFQRQFNDAIKEADLDDVKDLTSTKGFGPLEDARKSMEEFAQTMEAPVETQPEIEAPAIAPEAAAKPATKKPAAKKAPAKKTAAKKPAASKAAANKSTASKTAAKQPAASKPAQRKAAAKSTTAKTTAAKKPAAKKTAASAKSTS